MSSGKLNHLIWLFFAVLFLAAAALFEVSIEDREIALVRRHIPAVNIVNDERKLTAETGTSLFSGDTLFTDSNGYALVLFLDQSLVRVRPESQLIVRGDIDRNQNANTRIDLDFGGIFMDINRQGSNQFEVMTRTTTATVKGTVFGADSDGFHWVEEGEVEVTALLSGQAETILDGMFARVNDDGTDILTGQLTADELLELSGTYGILNQDLIEKSLKLRFRDPNGQIIEEDIEYYEQDNN